MNNLCDKCGLPVDPKQDAVRLDVEAGFSHPAALLVAKARHISCSPSRAQFVRQLNVVDERPEYDRRDIPLEEAAKMEDTYSSAYEKLQLYEP